MTMNKTPLTECIKTRPLGLTPAVDVNTFLTSSRS